MSVPQILCMRGNRQTGKTMKFDELEQKEKEAFVLLQEDILDAANCGDIMKFTDKPVTDVILVEPMPRLAQEIVNEQMLDTIKQIEWLFRDDIVYAVFAVNNKWYFLVSTIEEAFGADLHCIPYNPLTGTLGMRGKFAYLDGMLITPAVPEV